MFRLDNDGYIRMDPQVLEGLRLVHLISGSAEQVVPAGSPVWTGPGASGYTEWVSETIPAVSLGWEWVVDPAGVDRMPRRVGNPYGNVMIVDREGRDIGADRSAHLLGNVADRLNWQIEVLGAKGYGRG